MASVIPAILPATREALDEKLIRLGGVTDEVQIDIVDGRYATPASWPYAQKGSAAGKALMADLPELAALRFEVDLMVEAPESVIGHWVRAGASRITVHAESTPRLASLVKDFQVTYGHDKTFAPELLSFGLAISIDTDPALIEPYLDQCDYVQFMGIASIGKQGQPFDPRVLPKIRAFHKKHPEMPIQVDGGVSLETATDLLRAGASRLVVGSRFWKAGDLKATLREFETCTQTRGLYS